MPSNIEIKCLLKDVAAAHTVLSPIADSGPQTLHQEDFFFPCEGARLKLRVLQPDYGELIRYERTNAPEVRRSSYTIAGTQDPHALRDILTATLGTAGVVKKKRILYLVGQTRVHIDDVDGLGNFLEIEVVLRPDQSEDDGRRIASGLLAKLGIPRSDWIADAYIDLLACKTR